MVKVKDIIANPIILKMEAYKSINRELTAKNLELRQSIVALRDEVALSTRKIIEEREEQQHVKKTIISIITKCFNQIIKLLYPESAENNISSNISISMSTLKNLGDKSSTKHSAKNDGASVPSLRNCTFIKKNANSPLAEIQRNCNNVTLRSARAKERSASQSIFSKSLYGKESNEKAEEEVNNFEEESELEMSHVLLPVITEEASSFSQSEFVSYNEDSTVDVENEPPLYNRRRYSRKKRIDEIQNSVDLQQSHKLLTSYVNETCMESEDCTITGCNTEPSQKSSFIVEERTLNDTSLDGLSLLKATSSTPYRVIPNVAKNFRGTRTLKVVVPKLKPETLSRLGISIDSSTKMEEHNKEDFKMNSHTNKGVKQTKSNEIDFEKYEDKTGRPKRKAAESARSTLTERTLKVKLRRQ